MRDANAYWTCDAHVTSPHSKVYNFPWRGEVGRLVTHETDTRVPLASPEEMCVRGAAKMAARLYATRCKIRGLHRALSRVVRSSYKYT